MARRAQRLAIVCVERKIGPLTPAQDVIDVLGGDRAPRRQAGDAQGMLGQEHVAEPPPTSGSIEVVTRIEQTPLALAPAGMFHAKRAAAGCASAAGVLAGLRCAGGHIVRFLLIRTA